MAQLAEVTHHTAPRGQKTARARGEERDELHDAMGLMAPPSSRPTPLAEVRPQGRVLRHAVEQIVDVVPGLPTLDGPVPLMVEQLVDVLQLFDALIPVCRAGYRRAQDLHRAHPAANLARFVSRSWRNSWWKYRRSCHFPRFSGLWSRPWTFQFRRVVGDTQIFKVFSEDRVQQVSRRSLIFPVEVFIAQDRVCQRLLRTFQLVFMMTRMNLVKGFFRTFPRPKKKCEVCFALGVGTTPRVEPIHAGCSAGGSVEWVRLRDDNSGKPYYWNRHTRASSWKPPLGVKVVWIGERNEEGVVCYWHRDTRVSTFDLPPLPPG